MINQHYYFQAEVNDLQSKCKSLEEEVSDKEKKLNEAKVHAQSLQEEIILTQEKLDKAVHSSKSKISELQESNKGNVPELFILSS